MRYKNNEKQEVKSAEAQADEKEKAYQLLQRLTEGLRKLGVARGWMRRLENEVKSLLVNFDLTGDFYSMGAFRPLLGN